MATIRLNINENGFMSATTTSDYVDTQDTLTFEIFHAQIINSIDVSGHSKWIEIRKVYNGQIERSITLFEGNVYTIDSNTPKGTLLNVKIHFIEKGFLTTNDITVQYGIYTPQNRKILLQ